MKLTQYNEKLTYLDLGAGNGFLDIRAAGTVGADPEYRTGQDTGRIHADRVHNFRKSVHRRSIRHRPLCPATS